MTDMAHLEALRSTDLYAGPAFYVERPDGLPHQPEIKAQAALLSLVRIGGRGVKAFANANAGKRNPALAKREGITAGVFDLSFAWEPRRIAFVEMKGFDAKGRPGKLSQAQIDWGNAMLALGHDVACFFDPFAAVEWLRGKGCPIRKMEG